MARAWYGALPENKDVFHESVKLASCNNLFSIFTYALSMFPAEGESQHVTLTPQMPILIIPWL